MKLSAVHFKKAKSAFTLVELIVVIGLMAMLATVSITGYTAATRGMEERAVVDDTISFIRMARQRSLIDNVPTAVIFSSTQVKEAGAGGDVDAMAEKAGLITAVRLGGRISYVGTLLYDEYADWEKSYPATANAASSSGEGMRIYNMAKIMSNMGSGQESKSENIQMDSCSSLVNPYVEISNGEGFENDYMINTGKEIDDWLSDVAEREDDKRRYGFRVIGGLGVGQWQIGDAYAFEIASLKLPSGYGFGNISIDGEAKNDQVSAIIFWPNVAQNDSYQFTTPQITISAARLGSGGTLAYKKIRNITSDDLKDDD